VIHNLDAVVLWRRSAGEYDRRVLLLTERHGLLSVRFGGVDRPAGKLKALSEPLVWGEYRLCFSARSQTVRAAGGRIRSCFPSLRADLARTLTALALCELALRLCAERAPCPDKYRLLCRALCLLDQGGVAARSAPWLEAAFGLQLLAAAGWSLSDLPVPPPERALWRALHESDLEDLADLPWEAAAGRRFLQLVREHVEAHAQRPLRASDMPARLERFAASLRPRSPILDAAPQGALSC